MKLIGSATNGRVMQRRGQRRSMARSAWGGAGGAAAIAANQTARFGALTRAAAGGWKPLDSNGDAVTLTSYVSLVSGSLGSYIPSISNGNLIFSSGGIGAPAGAVLRVGYAGGTVDVTIGALVAGLYSVASLGEADLAYENSSLGNRIELRTGHHNPTGARVNIARGQSPAGTWTGTAALSDGNWVVLTREPGCKVKVGAMEIAGNGLGHPRYLRVDDLEFLSPLVADTDGFGPGAANGQVYLNGGSHAAVTNCAYGHGVVATGTTIGMFRAINSLTTDIWVEGNDVDGAQHGFMGYATRSVLKGNTFRRIKGDAYQISRCTDMILQGNISTDKLYGHTPRTITAIALGATTTFTVGTSLGTTVNDGAVLEGIGGALGAYLNGKMGKVQSITATTIVLQINTTGQPAWDGLSGEIQTANANHGDHCQFADDAGADNLQDRVTIRGNRFTRGDVPGHWPGGQGIFGGASVARTRSGWMIEGNIYCDAMVQAINVSNLVNSTVRSNTAVRQIGMDGANGNALPMISLGGTLPAGNTLVDNIANAYGSRASATTDLNNAQIVLVSDDAVPANPTTIANYQAALANPPIVPGGVVNPITDLATRTDTGGAYAGFPIFPGATPYYNYATHTYANPR